MQLTGTNSSFGLNALISQCPSNTPIINSSFASIAVFRRPGGLRRSAQTRSHPELGRQTLQRQWYYVSRPGRVGRRQACKRQINPLFMMMITSKTPQLVCGVFCYVLRGRSGSRSITVQFFRYRRCTNTQVNRRLENRSVPDALLQCSRCLRQV